MVISTILHDMNHQLVWLLYDTRLFCIQRALSLWNGKDIVLSIVPPDLNLEAPLEESGLYLIRF